MNNNLLKERLKGISAINITPFLESSGKIDQSKLRENLNNLIKEDFKIIVPCGNTGEYYSLTLEECKTVTKIALEEMKDQASGLVGVGHDTKTAIEQSLFAQKHGADGVMIHQPVHPHITEKGLVEYYKQIASAIDIGVVLYVKSDVLTITGYQELMKIDNIVGVKYALPTPYKFAETIHRLKGWDITWVCGIAESWAPFFYRAGGQGFTSGLVNIAPKKTKAMLKALQEDNSKKVMDVWKEVKSFEDLRAKYSDGNNVAVVKAAMNMVGGNYGNVRPPVSPLIEEDMNVLKNILQSWGYLK